MSDTPRTDAVVGEREYGSLADSEYVRLARQLERELTEARSQAAQGWARAGEKDADYGRALHDRDLWRTRCKNAQRCIQELFNEIEDIDECIEARDTGKDE